MMNEKFFLQSRTIIAAILMLVVQLGPLIGVSFGADDAAVVTEQIDAIITSALALIAMWGRVKAESTLVLFKSDRINSPWFVGAFALLLVAGCMHGNVAGTPQTPQQSYFAAKSSYAIAKEEAAAYAALPFCTATLVVYCAKPEVVVKLDDAADRADAAFATADVAFSTITSNPLQQETALATATVALRQLTAILALAVVAEAQS